MAVRSFNGTTDRLHLGTGNSSGWTFGTIVVLFKRNAAGSVRHTLLCAHDSDDQSDTGPQFWIDNSPANRLSYWADGSSDSGITINDTTNWFLGVVRKATGTVAPRFSVYNFGTDTWTHAAGGTALANSTGPGASGTWRFEWEDVDILNARVAAAAVWADTLPWAADTTGDAALEAAGLETAAANWLDADPSSMWLLNQDAVTTPVEDVTGGGADQVARTGTAVVTGDDPPGFSFDLGGGTGEVTASINISLAVAPVTEAVTVRPIVETGNASGSGDVADTAIVWLHPTDRAQSLILGGSKDTGSGGLHVFDLDGTELDFLPVGAVNSIDVRYGFPLGGTPIDLVGLSNRSDQEVQFYTVDPNTLEVTQVGSHEIDSSLIYGFCLAHDLDTGKWYSIATTENGIVEQWELDGSTGSIQATKVRTFDVGGITEGAVADDLHGWLFVGEEDSTLWRYGLDPSTGTSRTAVDTVSGNLTADIEGLTLYHESGGGGYLIASSQGASEFCVYERESPHQFVGVFTIEANTALGIDEVTVTDGIYVTNRDTSIDFPLGMFIAHDGEHSPSTNYKLVRWEHIASFLGLRMPDTSFDPRLTATQVTASIPISLDVAAETAAEHAATAAIPIGLDIAGVTDAPSVGPAQVTASIPLALTVAAEAVAEHEVTAGIPLALDIAAIAGERPVESLIVGQVAGPGRREPALTGPAIRRSLTGATARRVLTGAAANVETISGPLSDPPQIDGPELSRDVTGPDTRRVLTGPGV